MSLVIEYMTHTWTFHSSTVHCVDCTWFKRWNISSLLVFLFFFSISICHGPVRIKCNLHKPWTKPSSSLFLLCQHLWNQRISKVKILRHRSDFSHFKNLPPSWKDADFYIIVTVTELVIEDCFLNKHSSLLDVVRWLENNGSFQNRFGFQVSCQLGAHTNSC